MKSLSERERRLLKEKLKVEAEECENELEGWERKLKKAAIDDTVNLSEVNAAMLRVQELKNRLKWILSGLELMHQIEHNKDGRSTGTTQVAATIAGGGVLRSSRSRDNKVTFPKGALTHAEIQKALEQKKMKEMEQAEQKRIREIIENEFKVKKDAK